MFKHIYFMLFLCLAAIANFATAQTTNNDTLKLNIQQAEKIFMDKNLSILAAKYNIDAYLALVSQAKKWDNPTLNIDENIYNQYTKKYFDNTSTGQTYVQVQQLIKLGGKRKASVAIAKDNYEIAKLQLDDLLRNLRLTLHSDLFNAKNFIEADKLFADETTELEKLANAIGEQVKVGNAAAKDLLRVQADLFSTKNDRLQNQKQLIDVEAELRQLLMLPENAYVMPMVSDSISSAAVEKLDAGSLFLIAKDNRSDFKIQQMQTQQQQHNVDLQRAGEVPDLTLGPEFDHNSNYITDYWGLAISMPLPILNTNRKNVKAAKSFLSQSQEQQMQLEKNVATDVTSAVQKLKSSATLNENVSENLGKKYDEMLNNMLLNYRQRNLSLLELMDFFDTYKDTKLKALQLINDTHNAIEEVNFSVGKSIIAQ